MFVVCSLLVVLCGEMFAGWCLMFLDCWSLFVVGRLIGAGCLLLVYCCLLFDVCCLRFVVFCLWMCGVCCMLYLA